MKELIINGIPASAGCAIGHVYLNSKVNLVIDSTLLNSEAAVLEAISLLDEAVLKSTQQLTQIRDNAVAQMGEESALVFESHLMILEDPEFIGTAKDRIISEKLHAEAAMQQVTDMFVNIFLQMDNAYMRERSADIKDVGNRVIRNILGIEETSSADMVAGAIVVAHDLTPSDTAQLDQSKVIGFLTDIGGTTSHSAIMARSMGIPAIVGLGNITEQVHTGMKLILDGAKGTVILNPTTETQSTYEAIILEEKSEKERLKMYKETQLVYPSGRKLLVAANIGSVQDVEAVLENGGDGVGLLRTEFIFMDRDEMPTEEDQFQIYKAIGEKMSGKPVVIRTLDIGGDKQIPYLPMEKEENPFLGVRAIRLCLNNEDLFQTQLRAILRASVYGDLQIMFPMIGTLQELIDAKNVVEKCKASLSQEGIAFNQEIPIGMMIEIPSAALAAGTLAKHVDFFSIGTNDLIQYTMAIDRMNPNVAHLYQPMNEGVLKLIEMTVHAAHEAGIWCGMCGEMAADPAATTFLFGLELDEFSVSSSSILKTKGSLLELMQ